MALVKLRDFVPATDGTFVCPVTTLEQLGATRALLTTDDGVCQGYCHRDGRLWAGPLVTPSADKRKRDLEHAQVHALEQADVQAAGLRRQQLLSLLKAGKASVAEIQEALALVLT